MLPRCESFCLKHRGRVRVIHLRKNGSVRPPVYLCETAVEEAEQQGYECSVDDDAVLWQDKQHLPPEDDHA